MPREPIILHWDAKDDPEGNWQHIFEGHDVELEELVSFLEQYWPVRAAWTERPDRSWTVMGTSSTGRTLFAAVRILDREPPRVYVITCFPVGF